MNKQPTTIRAYLLRGAFLLSLAFVIVMPIALGQTRSRGSKPSVAAAQMPQVAQSSTGSTDGSQLPTAISTAGDAQAVRIPALPGSQLPTSGSTGVRSLRILPQPTLPSVVLYDQYDNDLNNGIVSANRTDNSSLSAEAADNFVVPGGQTWTITEVDIRSPVGFPTPTSFAVNFYTDNGSGLPGTQVYTASGLAVTGNPDYVITLTTPAVLSSGTYWVSAVGTITGTNWYWEGRSVTSNGFATAWRNPGGGYGLGCTDWARLQDCIGFSWPDQMFRIVGTIGGGTPTPTPTPSEIVLRVNTHRVGPNRKAVNLRWIGANSPRVDIFRNGVRIARVPTNPGIYTDVLFSPGLYTYKVCEAGSMNCSNEVTVR